MSFLGGSRSASNGAINTEKIDMAITEYVFPVLLVPNSYVFYRLDTVTDFFNRMVTYVLGPMVFGTFMRLVSRSCHNKCISARYADADLNKGEQVCIDRCVSKYNDVQKKVGEVLQARGAANVNAPNPSSFGSP